MAIRFIKLLAILFIYCNFCFGQKPMVNLDTYKTWMYTTGADLSANGKYALYIETVLPHRNTILRVKKTAGEQIYSQVGVTEANFSGNGRYVAAILAGDTLQLFNIFSKKLTKVKGVASYELHKWGNIERIFARSKNGDLTILDFTGKILRRVPNAREFKLLNGGLSMAAIVKDILTENVNLLWIDSRNRESKLLYSNKDISNLIVDNSGLQLAFLPGANNNEIAYYKAGMQAVDLIDIQSDLSLRVQYWSFNADGSRILFGLKENEPKVMKRNNLNLEIWSYQDEYLQSYYSGGDQIMGSNIKGRTYLAVLNVDTKEILQISRDKQIVIMSAFKPTVNNYCIVEAEAQVYSSKWPNGLGRSYYLCNLKTGEMILVKENTKIPHYRWDFSPSGRFVAYFDNDSTNYFCYDIEKKQSKNVTVDIIDKLINYQKLHYPNPRSYPLGALGWFNNDNGLLIQGTYDLWRVDPQAKRRPVNLTRGEGEKGKIIFSPALRDNRQFESAGGMILTAFDTRSKDYGFYELGVDNRLHLNKLSMQKYFIADAYDPLRPHQFKGGDNGFLVEMEQSDHAPNYFFSIDLKKFTAISDVRPELEWNWLKAELHTYKDSLGNELQGLLYKPENFDPEKKYPVLFGVYEFQSNHLNSFLRPDVGGAMFGIPWMVSNGYLVFLPDIKATPRYGGDGLTRCIVAGADHLANYSWVDTAKMGIAGHSVGGFVTNYAITHCNRFKAALSGAGISNMITASTDLWGDGAVKQEFLKDAVYMMDVDLLDDIPGYVRNSPMLSARSLTTPLLLLHNDRDGSVRFEQSRSFFIVLRSLHKPAWWLNYKGKNHFVFGDQEQIDYNTKVMQFFDHYLKGAPMPPWMKEHI